MALVDFKFKHMLSLDQDRLDNLVFLQVCWDDWNASQLLSPGKSVL